jgi:RNA polymerase sigma-70 factor (ECF subfamily)
MAIVRGLPRFDGTSRFTTWAYRVAVNATLDELRRRGRRAATDLDSARHLTTASADAGAADRIDIDHALMQLPVEFRAAVVLRDLCALDYAEIAHVLGIPPGTVRSRIARGRSALVPLLTPGNPGAAADRPTPQP